MIEINLLPHREARRKAELRQMLVTCGLAVSSLLLGIYLADNTVRNQRTLAKASIQQLQSDLARYKPQQAQVAQFKKTRTELKEKIAVIEGLDAARTGPVRVLEEVGAQTPPRLWLTRLRTDEGKITLEGASLDNTVVADFLRNLNDSERFYNVDLDSTESGHAIDGVELVNFVITADLRSIQKGQGGA
jgi:type IV pilus assembly protein PilN